MIYIGLDGGGTKTALTAIDDQKKILAAVTVWA
jgi:N-acetylglucosamine kinase-like BadF-type ATPase